MKYVICFIFVLLSMAVTAQVKGLVLDEQGRALEGATVQAFTPADSLLATVTSGKDGGFSLNDIKVERFVLRVSMTGREPISISVDPRRQTDLGALTMLSKTNVLSGVQVTAKKPPVEFSPGKTTVNIDASLTNAGNSALEVLEKTPGVYVDKDGNISLHGKPGITVMIDGKPSYLSGEQLKNYLAGLPASALDQIELMDHPSSRYDAAGTAGIINLKTKRIKREGLFGQLTVNASTGKVTRGNSNLNAGFQTGKWSLNTNLTISRNYQMQDIGIVRKVYDHNGLLAAFDQHSNFDHPSVYSEARFSADYQLSRRTVLGMSFSANVNPGTFNNTGRSAITNAHGELDSLMESYTRNKDRWSTRNSGLSFRHKTDTVGSELSADFTWLAYNTHSDQQFTNLTMDPNHTLHNKEALEGAIGSDLDVLSGRVDWVHPVKDGKWGMGLKQSHVRTDNQVDYQNIINSVKTPDYGKINSFLYREDLSAAYAEYEHQWKKLALNAGLRYERVRYSGWQHGNPTRTDSSFQRTYDNLFPTLSLSYSLDDQHKLGLSATRRIDRPAYKDLNPFLFYLDKYTYVAGNPFVRPQYSTGLELSHDYKNWLHTTVGYTHVKDLRNQNMEEAPSVNGQPSLTTILREGNIGKSNTITVNSNARIQIKKWWTMNAFAQYSYTQISGNVGISNGTIDVKGGSWSFNASEQFQWGKHWSAELNGFYNSRLIDGQMVMRPFGMMNAAVGYKIFQGRGSLKFTVRDVFYTGINQLESKFGSTVVDLRINNYTRNVLLNFTWKFGKDGRRSGPRRSAAEEEASRLKAG